MHKRACLVAVSFLAVITSAAHASLTPLAPGWSSASIADHMHTPFMGIAADPVTHDAFVIDIGAPTNTLFRVTVAGVRTELLSGAFHGEILAFDPVARVVFLSELGAVLRVSETGEVLGSIPGEVSALTIGADGALYGGAPGRVLRFDAGAGEWQEWRTFAPRFGLDTPTSLAFDGAGRLFATLGALVCRIEPGSAVVLGSTLVRKGLACSPGVVLCGASSFDPLGDEAVGNHGVAWVETDSATGMIEGVACTSDGRIYMTALGAHPGAGSVWVAFPPGAVTARRTTWGAIKRFGR